MKLFFIGYVLGALCAPIVGGDLSGAIKELTGKTIEEMGFQAGQYTREKILKLPPLKYKEGE
jgi:hypothetical protein